MKPSYESPSIFGGGPPFDDTIYLENIQQSREILSQSIHSYWDKALRVSPFLKTTKPIAIFLFDEENPGGDPYTLVCRNDPPKFAKGYQCLAYEIVPAWTLYLSRASALLEAVEKARASKGLP